MERPPTEPSPVDVVLRPYADGDVPELVRVFNARERAWWGEADTDDDDVELYVERAIASAGSAAAGTCVAVDGDCVIGVALMLGHGQSSFAVDPDATATHEARRALLDWQREAGATRIDAPSHDDELLADLAVRGFVPRLSSFDLERGNDVDDLGARAMPDGVELVSYRPGVDEQAVHDLIYSVWTDVEGHTFRPIDEWKAFFVSGRTFDPDLVVLARVGDGTFGGVAICTTFSDLGWVMQLATGRHARGIGLGRAVLVEALRRLAARPGVARLGLSVEADNAKALGLYRSVGLEVTREWRHCELVARESHRPSVNVR